MRNRCLGSDYCFSLASGAVFMCGVHIYNGVGCVYSYRGSQTVCLLTIPALPWSPALLPFHPMTSSGRWPPGSRSPMMYLHPDSIKRTLGASGLVLPHQQRAIIPDVEAADRSRCAGIQSEPTPISLALLGRNPSERSYFYEHHVERVTAGPACRRCATGCHVASKRRLNK